MAVEKLSDRLALLRSEFTQSLGKPLISDANEQEAEIVSVGLAELSALVSIEIERSGAEKEAMQRRPVSCGGKTQVAVCGRLCHELAVSVAIHLGYVATVVWVEVIELPTE